MKFYVIQDEYVAHLQAVDHRVSHNKNMTRLFMGIVFEVGDFDYFAPLTSHKDFHTKITASDPRYFKLHEFKNPSNPLGMARLCNMIPLVAGTYSLFDVDSSAEHYKRLIQKQARFISSKQDEVRRRAALLYQRVAEGRPPDLIEECCTFQKLEEAAVSYAKDNGLSLRAQKPSVGIPIKKEIAREKRPTLTLANRALNSGLNAKSATPEASDNENH